MKKDSKVNCYRLLRAQTLTVSFKTPWIFLAETNITVRGTDDVSIRNSEWWCLLNKARTHFEENPLV